MLLRPAAPLARMPHLFQPAGEAALAAVLQRGPLLAFDFDGTLAPIVSAPELARISASVAGKLRQLATRLPVAIVTGRRVDDVRGRLGFEPHCIVGNHGAEMDADALAQGAQQLDEMRRHLAAHLPALQAAGVTVEDKGLSIALHYRLSRDPHGALALVRELLQPFQGRCETFAGKMVENVAPAGAPDKATAVHTLVRRMGASCAVFLGDDVNDEPVFAAAPPDWLTVRIGRGDPHSRARFFLDSTAEVAMLLERMLALLQGPR